MTRFIQLILAVFALHLQTPTLAQDVAAADADEHNNVICILSLWIWNPSPEETAQIKSKPLPETFVSASRGGPCGSGLYQGGLLDWHLAFGTPETTAAALAFYRQRSAHRTIRVEDYPDKLEEAWKGVLSLQPIDKGELAQATQGRGPKPLALKIADLRSLVSASERYDYLLDLHLKAASFYRTARFSDEAAPYLRAVEARNELFNEHFDELLEAGITAPRNWDSFNGRRTTRINPYKRAILRYRIQGEDADFDALRREAIGPYRKAISELSDLAWQHPDTFNISSTRYDALKEAYEAENDFAYFAVRVLYEDVILALSREMQNADPNCHVDNFSEVLIWLRHLEHKGDDEGQPTQYYHQLRTENHRDKRLELLLAKAECHISGSKKVAEKDDSRETEKQIARAFETLGQARQLVQADESPARFSQIAKAYLDTAKFCRSLEGEKRDDGVSRAECSFDINRRLETYFRINIEALDTIATAARSPQ